MQRKSLEIVGMLSKSESALLKKLYAKGPAAYGSVRSLQLQSGLSKEKVERFLHSSNVHTKYRNGRRKFRRLKVIAYRINEIWSIDLAYVDKLANFNKGINYLMVAVDVLSRYVRVEPMKNKFATTARSAFQSMLRKSKVKPEMCWTDKGTEFQGSFREFCERKGIKMYTTHSETKSAFAERAIRSLKSILYKYMEDKWTYSYLKELPLFVRTLNTRVNRVTKLAPYKVKKQDEPYLITLMTSKDLNQKPKLGIGNLVRISKEDIPFRKGYRQQFTDEIFEIYDIATTNPVTYRLKDSTDELILGKFYEKELVKIYRQNGSV